MIEWLSYSLTDLLLFSPFSYFRLFELSNEALWPWQIPLLLVAIGCGWLVKRADQHIAWPLLAILWGFVAWWFFLRHYSQIYPAAEGFALFFIIEAVLLSLITFGNQSWIGDLERAPINRIGWTVFIYALLFHPLLTLLMGRPESGMELFGIAPDPTALGTLGLLLSRRGWMSKALAVIPLFWLLLSSLTHLAMENFYGLIAPVMGYLAVVITALAHRMIPPTNR